MLCPLRLWAMYSSFVCIATDLGRVDFSFSEN
jgi:hypothetical protein